MIEDWINAAASDKSLLPILYAKVAVAIRQCYLSEAHAEIIAEWFDRLAAGESGDKVFPQKRAGRTKGKTKKPRPDDIDIAWIARRLIEQHGMKPGEVYENIAKANHMGPRGARTVSNICSRLRRKLPPDPG